MEILQRVIVLGHVLQISPVPCGGYTRSLSFQVPKQNKLKQFIAIPFRDDGGIRRSLFVVLSFAVTALLCNTEENWVLTGISMHIKMAFLKNFLPSIMATMRMICLKFYLPTFVE